MKRVAFSIVCAFVVWSGASAEQPHQPIAPQPLTSDNVPTEWTLQALIDTAMAKSALLSDYASQIEGQTECRCMYLAQLRVFIQILVLYYLGNLFIVSRFVGYDFPVREIDIYPRGFDRPTVDAAIFPFNIVLFLPVDRSVYFDNSHLFPMPNRLSRYQKYSR